MSDTFATATDLSFAQGTNPLFTTGTIGGTDPFGFPRFTPDSDFFTFTATEDGTLQIFLTGLASDIDLRLLDQDGFSIDESENFLVNNTTNQGEFITISVSAGTTYGLELVSFAGSDASFYQLSSIFSKSDDNSFANALKISDLPAAEGVVDAADPSDFLTFTASETGDLTLLLAGASDDIDLVIFESNQTQLGVSSRPSLQPESVTISVVAGEDYFVQVSNTATNGGGTDGSYNLYSTFETDLSNPQIEAITNSDLTLSADTSDLLGSARWVPGQTLGYTFADQSLTDAQRDIVRDFLSSLSDIIDLDFVEDAFGPLQFVANEALLDQNTFGLNFSSDPFQTPIQLTSLAESEVILHQIFHALGAVEPLNGDGTAGQPFTLFGQEVDTIASGQNIGYIDLNITGFLALDLQFLAETYGSDSSNLADNIYRYSTSTSVFEGLHDAGGTDTIMVDDADAIGVALDLSQSGGLDFGTLVDGVRLPTVFQTAQTVIENVVTEAGNDSITGNSANNIFTTGAGDDLLNGGGGNDTLSSGSGNDTLTGGAGRDMFILSSAPVSSEANLDVITDFTLGSDTFSTEIGDNLENYTARNGTGDQAGNTIVFNVETGVDAALVLGVEASALVAQTGLTTGNTTPPIETFNIIGTDGSDTLTGMDGDDTLTGFAGNDVLDGGNGADSIDAGGGDDLITGGDGDDTIIGSAGADTIDGGRDSDFINGGGGNDMITGGSGSDTLVGSIGNDTLSSDRGVNSLNGQNGDDVLIGGRAKDVLVGGAGSDFLDGQGGGLDQVIYSNSSAGIVISLAEDGEISVGSGGEAQGDTLTNVDQVNASGFADQVNGNSNNNRLLGLDGDDTITGGAGNDTLSGASGNDILEGGSGNDTVLGQNDNDIVSGGDGNDLVAGGNGDDLISGGNGNDTLLGQGGNDVLNGGAGDDILSDSSGNDLFVYDGLGNDQIIGLSASNDTLDLSGAVTAFNLTDPLDVASQTDDGILFQFGEGASLLLTGLSLQGLANLTITVTDV